MYEKAGRETTVKNMTYGTLPPKITIGKNEIIKIIT
jgi:hypothetical protein